MPLDIGGNIITSNSFSANGFTKTVIQDGLVLHLDAANKNSYPGSGTSWTDLTRNGNNGTLNNGVSYSSANSGTLVFDGSNDYVSVPNSSNLNFGTGDFTVLVWVGGITSYPGSAKCIIEKGSRFDGNLAGWSIIWAGSPQDLYFIIGSSSARLEGRTVPNFGLNGWTGYKMIGMMRGGSNWYQINNGNVTTLGTFSGDVSNSQAINIGYNSYYGSYLSQNVPIVQIYNRTLNRAEIMSNYYSVKSRF